MRSVPVRRQQTLCLFPTPVFAPVSVAHDLSALVARRLFAFETSEVYSGFFVEEEGTWSSLRGVRETLERRGLFCSLYTDRGSHYRHTPAAGGAVDKANPTQFGRAMGELGIEMIPSYSPEARGCQCRSKTPQKCRSNTPQLLRWQAVRTARTAGRCARVEEPP